MTLVKRTLSVHQKVTLARYLCGPRESFATRPTYALYWVMTHIPPTVCSLHVRGFHFQSSFTSPQPIARIHPPRTRYQRLFFSKMCCISALRASLLVRATPPPIKVILVKLVKMVAATIISVMGPFRIRKVSAAKLTPIVCQTQLIHRLMFRRMQVCIVLAVNSALRTRSLQT